MLACSKKTEDAYYNYLFGLNRWHGCGKNVYIFLFTCSTHGAALTYIDTDVATDRFLAQVFLMNCGVEIRVRFVKTQRWLIPVLQLYSELTWPSHCSALVAKL